ncbi:hypothetical protein K461DRAFT_274961 [Myriangium duriaei CBS 260.36]|uniref:Transfer RNA methyltransferase 82 n=1 Tax=Myriangium duriaei CBS 260.36 TaxID=1168546 RepID=A0A9P4MK22_9PEZI|nr:hypothetical protein K461DRAFT_274961 [Myriangium duriaei CBS 260.36]
MHHPFQHLCEIAPDQNVAADRYLIAACGPNLYTIAIGSGVLDGKGKIKAKWSTAQEQENTEFTEEPQQKKRKLSHSATEAPAIIKLVRDSGHKHVAIVTEDKCITIFEVGSDGTLKQLNQRCMPKRPCAIEFSSDIPPTIVCGDKFGDVYSLPLHVPEDRDAEEKRPNNANSQPKVYSPAATEMTVHTQRNRKALEEQMRAKGRPTQAKEPLAFEHKLLLGHVSMLTDLQITTLHEDGTYKPRIITCDRDEHIRVSRGMPQSHVIEAFCMGHTEFLSKLKLLPETEILLSGGGDDWMGVWNWKSGQLLAKHDLRQLKSDIGEASGDADGKIAVQNIWVLHRTSKPNVVVVKTEGSLTLAMFDASTITDSSKTAHFVRCEEMGDILDIVSLGEGEVIVSTDGSTRLHSLQLREAGGTWELVRSEEESKVLSQINAVEVDRPEAAKLDTLLHGVERLRKQDFDDDQEA